MLNTIVTRSVVLLIGGIFAMVAFQELWPDLFGDEWRPPERGAAQRSAPLRPASYGSDRNGPAPSAGTNEIAIRAEANGHFLLQAEIEGETVDFVVDTGATLVVLSLQDAERIGIDPTRLEYDETAQSANGAVAVARVVISEVRVGQLAVRDVEAMVNSGPMPVSLLGNSFLGRLESYEMSDDTLVMRW